MPKTAKWRGSKQLTESPESPRWDFAGDAVTLTQTFHGPYELCLTKRPKRGSELQGFSGFVVDKSSVNRARGGQGVLSVIASGSAESPELNKVEEKYEIEWTELERPLTTNPCFLPGGAHALTVADRTAIQKWEDCPDADVKAAMKFYNNNDTRTPAGGTDLSANAQVYAAKILNGVESWVQFVPVAKKTTLTAVQPSSSAAGFINDPSGFGSALPDEFMWLKTADRSMRTGRHGKWERTEEWTGAISIDGDLYDEVV